MSFTYVGFLQYVLIDAMSFTYVGFLQYVTGVNAVSFT